MRDLDHTVTLYGYGTSPEGVDYWLVSTAYDRCTARVAWRLRQCSRVGRRQGPCLQHVCTSATRGPRAKPHQSAEHNAVRYPLLLLHRSLLAPQHQIPIAAHNTVTPRDLCRCATRGPSCGATTATSRSGGAPATAACPPTPPCRWWPPACTWRAHGRRPWRRRHGSGEGGMAITRLCRR